MNPARLLEHFDRIAEAPDAIPRLRWFILDLAVRGKLVEQDPNDEPASRLMERISKSTRKPCRWDSGHDGDTPFELPNGWEWSRLGLITTKTGSGSTPRGGKSAYHPQGIPFLRSQNVHNDGLRLGDVAYIDEATHTKMRGTAVEPGDLLLNITGGSIGRCCRLADTPIQANISQHVAIVRLAIPGMRDFAHIVVLSPFFQSFIIDQQTGAGREGLPKNRMDQIPVPVPPLAEQHRIVAKVDELMALCDRLDSTQTKRENRRDRLASASLRRISQPEAVGNGEEFHENVRFHLDQLPRLTTRLEHIKELRQTILNLAVRGKLVPQGEEKLRADVIAAQVRLERKRERTQSLSPGENAKTRINFSEIWTLPHSWAMLSLSDLALQIVDCPHSTPIWAESGKMCVRTSQFSPGYLSLSNTRFVSEETFAVRIQRLKPCENDILYSREGGILGVACRVPPGVELCLGQRMMLIRSSSVCRPEFLELVLNSPLITGLAKAQTTGGAAPRINVSTVKSYPIPLPPLAEQSRILAKVRELMAICDQLEAQITTAQADRSRLLETTLCEALGISNMPIPRAGRVGSTRATPANRQAERPLQVAKPRLVEPAHTAPQRSIADRPKPAPDSRSQSAPEAILAQMKPGHDYSRAQLCDALGLSVYEWNMAIRALKENGQVIQTGEKRGARYRLNMAGHSLPGA